MLLWCRLQGNLLLPPAESRSLIVTDPELLPSGKLQHRLCFPLPLLFHLSPLTNLSSSLLLLCQRNPKIPKEHRALDPQVAFPASCSWNCSRFQGIWNLNLLVEAGHCFVVWCNVNLYCSVADGFEISESCGSCTPRSCGGVFGGVVRGHKPVCYSCQEGYHNAQGYSTRQAYPWWTCLSQLIHCFFTYERVDF